jgi:Na(+)-translocating NADH:ubiquinone oxidoreductase A subunit
MSAFKTEIRKPGKRPRPLKKGTAGRIIPGGYSPRIAGRPAGTVEEITVPGSLHLDLTRRGVEYRPLVRNGQRVEFGQALAEAPVEGGTLSLPAPAAGKVELNKEKSGGLILKPDSSGGGDGIFKPVSPERLSAARMRALLAAGGIWPLFSSTRTSGTPPLENGEPPRAIVVNLVLAEPFRARGKVVLQSAWEQVVKGIRFLPRLLADYGKVEIILTAVADPVARRLSDELSGRAWIRLHSVPVRYPLENPQLIRRMLRRSIPDYGAEDPIWVIDGQGIGALGACLGEGLPLQRRLIALSGPGASRPKHFSVTIGTPISHILHQNRVDKDILVLRGGLFTGTPVDAESAAVGYDDDAYFLLPARRSREFLSFLRPGFKRTSYAPAFVSSLTGAADSHITNSLRGERRPCIACGLCEQVCPVDILPQVLHRYIYREAYDEAARAGLDRCIDCNLCTFVCPSKIELQRQFAELREQLRAERAERAEQEPGAVAGGETNGGKQ